MSAARKNEVFEEDFEPTYQIKEFSQLIKRPPRYIENIRDNHGFPFYNEGRKVTYKISDFVKWREERRQVKK